MIVEHNTSHPLYGNLVCSFASYGERASKWIRGYGHKDDQYKRIRGVGNNKFGTYNRPYRENTGASIIPQSGIVVDGIYSFNDKPGASILTIYTHHDLTIGGGNTSIAYNGSGSGGISLGHSVADASTHTYYFQVRAHSWAVSSASYTFDPSTVEIGETLVFCGTYGSEGPKMYLNGADITADCTVVNENASSMPYFSVYDRISVLAASTNWMIVPPVTLGYMFNFQLTSNQVASLSKDPWQLFKIPPIIGAHQLPTHVDYGKVKVPWTSQPPAGTPIDWSNPLAKGLTFLSVPGTDNGNYRDLVTGQTYTSTNGTLVTGAGRWGRSLEFDGTGTDTYVNFGHNSKWEPDQISVTCFIRPDSTFQLQEIIRKGNNSGGDSWNILLNYDGGTSPGSLAFWVYANSSFTQGPAFVITPGEEYAITGTYDESNIRLYVDGLERGSPVAKTGAINKSGDNMMLGARPGTTADRHWFGGMFAAMIHDRPLSAAETKALHDNPWQIFKPREIMVPINEDLPELVRFEVQS